MVGHSSAKEHQRAAGQFKEHKYTTNPNQHEGKRGRQRPKLRVVHENK
jgi:hypothetical protein